MSRIYIQYVITETKVVDDKKVETNKSLIISGVDDFHAHEHSMVVLANYKLPTDATEAEIAHRYLDASDDYEITLANGATVCIEAVDDIYITDEEAAAMAAVGYLIHAPAPVTILEG